MSINPKHIAEGWARKLNVIPTDEDLKRLSEERMKICESCPFSKKSKVLKLLNGEAREISQLYCSVCHCPCEQKSLVKAEKCPKGKWQEE